MSIYYISAASGSDVNSGLTEALAWATVDKGMNTVVAGDKVYVKGDGNYNEKATIDTVGSGTLPIIFEGYTSVTGDNGRVTIDAQNTRVNCVDDSLGVVAGHYVFKNFRFTDATNTSFNSSLFLMKFKNCRFDSAGSIGVSVGESVFEDCEIDENGDTGLSGSNTNILLGCKFANNIYADHDNGSNHIFYGCTFFSAGEFGINVASPAEYMVVLNSTFDGDSKDTTVAFDTEGGDKQLVSVNNIFYDNGTALRNPIGQRCISRNNLFNANTNKYQLGAGTYTSEINGAPVFVNEATNDYRLDNGSSGIKNGFDASIFHGFSGGMDIGAFQVLGTGLAISSTPVSSSGDLFINGLDLINDNVEIFIQAKENLNNDNDLFIYGYEVINDQLNLIFVYPSFKTNTQNLFINGSEPIIALFDLFINGSELITNDINIFIMVPFTGSLDSFIEGYIVQTSGIDLFVHGLGLKTNDMHLSIHGTVSGLPPLETGDDDFGLSLEQLFKNGDYNPQVIGRFTTDPNTVTIEIWDVIDGANTLLVLSSNDCYQIGDTGRWAFSTANLPQLPNIINQYVYRMTGDTTETFDGKFILRAQKRNTNKMPRNNDHIRKV